MKSPDELTQQFRAQGLKVTPQRQCIFRVLHDNPQHPTAESVYAEVSAEMPTISLRTVYQTLNDLASMGELVQLDLGTGSARFDPNLDGHHHLVCDRCGRVLDVEVDTSAMRMSLAERQGFTIDATQIVFRGTCADCNGRAAPTPVDASSHPTQQPQQEEHINA
jgi:Fur family peroxide stress response transcriptional regulator